MFYRSNAKIFQYAHALRANMTDAERKLWDRLSNKQLEGFRFKRQHPITNYIADFYCHRAKLIIEVDGKIHEDPKQIAHDNDRTVVIEALGCRILRFTNSQVMGHLEEVVHTIKMELQTSPSGRQPPLQERLEGQPRLKIKNKNS